MRTKYRLGWLISLGALTLVSGVAPRSLAHDSRLAGTSTIATSEQAVAASREIALTVDVTKSKMNFALGSTLHTVHGTFALKHGEIRIAPDGKASGEIVADATSGQSGDSGRDKKMHKDVLESPKFTEVVFRPDRVDGKIPVSGVVSVQMHGVFALHGSEHAMTVPVTGEMNGDHWSGKATLKIPYVAWGLKSPNTFILKADPVVEVELELVGTTGSH